MTDLEILDAIKAGTAKPHDRSTAIALLVGSAAVFLLVGINQWDVQHALLLVASIFIHECGHLAAMWACRYKNLKIMFLPFFGAVASGRPDEQNGLKIAIISFAGPIAGILAAGVALLVWRASHNPVLLSFAQITLLLNGFNLLPILPLDGGHILNEALLARHPKAELGFSIAASAALVILAFKFGTIGLAAIAVALVMRMNVAYKMASSINRLRGEEGMMGSDLTEGKVGRIREQIETANPLLRKMANAPKLPAQVEVAWANVNKVFPGAAAVAALLTAYFVILLLVVPFGIRKTVQFKFSPVFSNNNEGLQLMEKRDFKGAVADFDKALELQPHNLVLTMNRGVARYGAGDYAGATVDLSKVLEREPDAQLAYVYRAYTFEATGDFQLEIDDCSAALRLKSDDALMLIHRGYAESRTGIIAPAIADCDRAVALSPKSPELLQYRAYVKDIAGDFPGAAIDYSNAAKASLTSNMARIRWAMDLRRQKLSDAEAELGGRAPVFNDPWIRSIGLYLTGKLDEGQLMARAEASAPDRKSRCMGQAFYYIGITHLLANDPDGARGFFERSVKAGLRVTGETGLAQAELGRLGRDNNAR